jgi:2-hydroxychromene-2-carboxylate isomerase
MHRLRFYFDPISPYAALAFWRVPEQLAGHHHVVDYVPILFAAALKANATKGPAEIPAKRAWTYRHVRWLAQHQGQALQMPASHPFNPLPLLRLAWACAAPGATPSRWVVEQLFDHVWRGDGAEATDPARLAALAAVLAPQRKADEDAAKARLREATDAALAAGVFGVPTLEWQGRLFWGNDALPMLRAALDGDPWFAGPDWDAAAALPVGVRREAG